MQKTIGSVIFLLKSNGFRVLDDHLGVSPTVGVILMVAITVVLAVTVGFVVLDLGSSTSQNARAGVSMEETPSGVFIQVNSMGGNTKELVVVVNGEPLLNATLTTAGDSVTVGATDGSTVSVRGTTSSGSSSVIQTTTTTTNTSSTSNPELISSSTSSGSTSGSGSNDTIMKSETQPEPTNLGAVYENMSTNSSGWYIINNSQQLQAVDHNSTTRSQNYILGQNIDASNTSNWNSGAGFQSIGGSNDFTGKLDGKGYAIYDLYINRPSSTAGHGVFGSLSGATVSNLGVENANITGAYRVAGIAGGSQNSLIEDSYVTGTIKQVNENNADAGGIVGGMSTGDIIRRTYSTADVSGSTRVGGLVGFRWEGQIQNSYATGNVTGDSAVGGLVGSQQTDGAGGTSGSYWDTQATGQSSSDGGTPLTTAEMTGTNALNNMSAFSSSNWHPLENNYPELEWQNSTA